MERFEINKNISLFEQKLKEFYIALKIDDLKKEVIELKNIAAKEDFWNDQKKALENVEREKVLTKKINDYSDLEKLYNDIIDFLSMYDEEEDELIMMEIEEGISNFNKKMSNFEIDVLLNNNYDDLNCILEIHPGAGGTESQDWALMLFRMYQRFCNKNNFKLEIMDYQNGEEAGIKSVMCSITGKNAYGLLKSERGVHRLVRISPFDSNKRRHTSFASVDIMPQTKQDFDIEVKDEDIKIDVYRSSGAGGQSVNTTDSAVRITHLKTNIVVTCQNERSQIKNREKALNILKGKLMQLEIKKQEEELNKIKGVQKDIAWGSQIRSYVFTPYTLVKDHRTNYETSNVSGVMDGNIIDFIFEYLKYLIED